MHEGLGRKGHAGTDLCVCLVELLQMCDADGGGGAGGAE